MEIDAFVVLPGYQRFFVHNLFDPKPYICSFIISRFQSVANSYIIFNNVILNVDLRDLFINIFHYELMIKIESLKVRYKSTCVRWQRKFQFFCICSGASMP